MWDLKNSYIVPIHEWKMLVKYGGINLELCSPLLLLKSGGHHGWGKVPYKWRDKKTHVGIHTAYRGIKGLACISVKDKQIALLIVVHVGLHCWLSPSSLFVVVSRHRFSSSSLSSWLLCNWLSSSSGMGIMMMMIIIIIIMDGWFT